MAVTVTYKTNVEKSIKSIVMDWVSNASGAATETLTMLSGIIKRVTFKPDGGGTQPSNSYDVTLKDDEEVDVLMGLGANLSNAAATSVVPFVTNGTFGEPVSVNSTLDLAVANAGDTKGGTIVLFYK